MRKYKEEFQELFDKLCVRHDRYSIFYDFVKMCSISIYNVFAKNKEMEASYLKIINSYEKNEQKIFSEMFAKLVMIYENSYEIIDVLGPIYMNIKSKDKQLGQVFTPYHISEFMAEILIGEQDLHQIINRNGYISLNEPTCGAGRYGTGIRKSIR